MLYNVFTVEQDAVDAEAIDYKIWQATHSREPLKSNTEKYANINKLKDGRFAYPVYMKGMQVYTQEYLVPSDFEGVLEIN